MFDLKPDAPAEIRGEFKPIKTNVPGIDICEHFPKLARMMDKLILIRSITGSSGDHDAYQCMTGRRRTPQLAGFWPSMGAWVSKVQGQANRAIPPHLTLMYRTGEQSAGVILKQAFSGFRPGLPFRLVGGSGKSMKPDGMVPRTRPSSNCKIASASGAFDLLGCVSRSQRRHGRHGQFHAAGAAFPYPDPGSNCRCPGPDEGERQGPGSLRRERSGFGRDGFVA